MVFASKKSGLRVCLIFAITLLPETRAYSQEPGDAATELKQLRLEVEKIEVRIDELEQAQAAAKRSDGGDTLSRLERASNSSQGNMQQAAAPPVSSSSPDPVKNSETSPMDSMDSGMGGESLSLPFIPQIKIRGFGDVRGFLANQNLGVIANTPGSPTPQSQAGESTFGIGLMDLFLTSQINDHFSYLAEIGFEADSATNGIGVDLERVQLSFNPNDKFSLSIGRTHAMLGYYNTAFHHGTWFQTTIDRPRIFNFEDSGGPLPIHNVGLAAMGRIPSGKLGLHWLAEVGNGKQTYSLMSTVTPANVLADHNGKSTNVGLLSRPDRLEGMQAGFNWYQASLVPVVASLPGYGQPGFAFPNATNYYKQNIFVAHTVYITPKTEIMMEGVEVRDAARGSSKPFYTSGGYGQFSHAFGVIRPYERFSWLNPNFNDPNNAWVGRWVGPTTGVRWDINAFVAMKLEYSHYAWKNFSADPTGTQILPLRTKTIDQLGAQMTYTF